MRVAIMEQKHVGHYYSYVRLLVEAVRPLVDDVVLLVSPEGASSPEFRTELADAARSLDVRPALRLLRPGMLASSLDSVENLHRALRDASPDVLLVSTGDQLAEAAGLASVVGAGKVRRRVHCECLMTRLTFTYPDSVRRVPARVVLSGLRRSPFDPIHIIDVLAYQWIRRFAGGALAEKFRLHPDPVAPAAEVSRTTARERLGIPNTGRYLCCPGQINTRKGVDLLIEAFGSADLRSDDRLLLVGKTNDKIRELLAGDRFRDLQAGGRLQLIDRHVSPEEFALAFRAADVIVCPYPLQPHPSSIAVNAMAAERPVLGADSFWIGQMVPMFGMGWTVDVKDPTAFAAALRASLESAPRWRRSEAARRLVAFNSVDAFKSAWTVSIRNMLGLPPAEDVRSWSWVMEALSAG